MDEIEKSKIEKFKKRMSKKEKLTAKMSDFVTDEKGIAVPANKEDFEKLLSGEKKIYFSYGSIKIELDGNNFDVRYFDEKSEETLDEQRRLLTKDIFEEELGKKVNDEELDKILSDKFANGEYKIVGNVKSFDGAELEHKSEEGRKIIDCKRKEEDKGINENDFVKTALDNAKRIPMGDKTYLDVMLAQRIEGPSNAGSSYKVDSPEELYDKLISQEWEETTHPDVMPGCKVYKSNLAGLEGILNMENLPDDVELYAIDPKETGKVGIGAGKVEKNPVQETYLIIGKENIDGKDEDVVFTFHPGEPVRPSEVETKEIPDGTRLSKEEAQKLGFDKVKYLSDEMLEEYRHKQNALELEEKVSENEKLNSEISKAEKTKEEK